MTKARTMDDELNKANERISQLEIALTKRSILLYAMMKTLSHDYQSFLVDESDELFDRMCSLYGTNRVDISKKYIADKLIKLDRI